MSNNTIISNNITLSLDELLDSLGFDHWKTLVASFVFPTISLIGTCLCSLSAWIFYQSHFTSNVFFYYRLLCIVYIVHLIHNIPHGLLFSFRYFANTKNMNTYASSIFQIYYGFVTTFLFHYEDVLQMGILLDRIKIFSPFVKKHFTASPQKASLAFLLTCLLIDVPVFFRYKISPFGTYYYLDSNNQKQITTFYHLNSSVFSMTSFGKSVLIFTVLFLNQLLTLLVGILLNILSVYKFKKYLQFKRHIKHETQQQQSEVDRELSQKELDEFKAEKNMFIMALFLCTLSILSRCLIMFYYVYALIYDASSLTQTFGLLNYMVFTMVPSMGVFVFYSFNKMFRQEFKRKFWF
jgi:hypothetical protein